MPAAVEDAALTIAPPRPPRRGWRDPCAGRGTRRRASPPSRVAELSWPVVVQRRLRTDDPGIVEDHIDRPERQSALGEHRSTASASAVSTCTASAAEGRTRRLRRPPDRCPQRLPPRPPERNVRPPPAELRCAARHERDFAHEPPRDRVVRRAAIRGACMRGLNHLVHSACRVRRLPGGPAGCRRRGSSGCAERHVARNEDRHEPAPGLVEWTVELNVERSPPIRHHRPSRAGAIRTGSRPGWTLRSCPGAQEGVYLTRPDRYADAI